MVRPSKLSSVCVRSSMLGVSPAHLIAAAVTVTKEKQAHDALCCGRCRGVPRARREAQAVYCTTVTPRRRLYPDLWPWEGLARVHRSYFFDIFIYFSVLKTGPGSPGAQDYDTFKHNNGGEGSGRTPGRESHWMHGPPYAGSSAAADTDRDQPPPPRHRPQTLSRRHQRAQGREPWDRWSVAGAKTRTRRPCP